MSIIIHLTLLDERLVFAIISVELSTHSKKNYIEICSGFEMTFTANERATREAVMPTFVDD